MFASAQLRIPIVCLRAWQFGQSVKPKVNISPLSPSAQCLSLILAPAPSEPSGGPSNHPRTIPWPAPSLLLGQHWTQFRKVRPSGHFSEADARLTRCDLITVIASSDGETKWSVEEKGRNIDIKWSQKDHLKWSDLNSMRKNKWMAKCLRKQYQFYKLSGLS